MLVEEKNGVLLPKKVAILYSDVKREYFPTEVQYLTEKDARDDAQIIGSYLAKMGITVYLYPGNDTVVEKLKKDRPNMVMNLVDSFKGVEYLSATIPGVLELLEIPYTGAGILGTALDHNKFLIKKLLKQIGVPIPNYQLFNSPYDFIDSDIKFPVISKLNEIHGAVEITNDSISENEKHLRERLKFLIKTYEQPVLVEEFVNGKEITAILLEGLNKKVYLAEKIFSNVNGKYKFFSFEYQWNEEAVYQKYNDPVLREYVKKAFDITKMADYGKFDIRIDELGRYYFIDCNRNPSFGPKECDCAISNILSLYDISFQDILKRLLLNTMRDKNEKNLRGF